MLGPNRLTERAKTAKRESKYLDFKESFDPSSEREWIDVVKDIIAMANSGGGVLLFGMKNDGTPSGSDLSKVLTLDPAVVTDKVARYTGEQFSDFSIEDVLRDGTKVAGLRILGARVPIVFIRPGTYDVGGGKQKTAFSAGTVYFRHGAKSEPGNSNDLRQSIERELERIRKSWLGNIREVVEAPPNQQVRVVHGEPGLPLVPTEIRVVDRKEVIPYGLLDPSSTHPHRQKEVLDALNRKLIGRRHVTTYDVLCIRKAHGIDQKTDYFYKPKYGSPQYSEAFVDWLARNYEDDPSFFDKAKERHRDMERRPG